MLIVTSERLLESHVGWGSWMWGSVERWVRIGEGGEIVEIGSAGGVG